MAQFSALWCCVALQVMITHSLRIVQGPAAAADGPVQFEPLLAVRAGGSWTLGPAGSAVDQRTQVLHVIYTASSCGGSPAVAASSSVLGVGRLELALEPWLESSGGAGGAPRQPQLLPIQHEALQQCQLYCPSSGQPAGSMALAARLRTVPGQQRLMAPVMHSPATGGETCTAKVTVCCSGSPRPAPPQPAAGSSPSRPQQRHAVAQVSPARPKQPQRQQQPQQQPLCMLPLGQQLPVMVPFLGPALCYPAALQAVSMVPPPGWAVVPAGPVPFYQQPAACLPPQPAAPAPAPVLGPCREAEEAWDCGQHAAPPPPAPLEPPRRPLSRNAGVQTAWQPEPAAAASPAVVSRAHTSLE